MPSLIDSFKDHCNLHYFLGIKLLPILYGLFLTQHKYIRDLLTSTKMDGVKEVLTPMTITEPLVLNENFSFVDAKDYL